MLYIKYHLASSKRSWRVLKRICQLSPGDNLSEHCYNYQVSSDMLQVAQSVTVVPEPIKRIVDAIGYLKYEGKVYASAVGSLTMRKIKCQLLLTVYIKSININR